MTSTLIVSDNEILNQLYKINLEVYLATDVTVVLSTGRAQELIEAGGIYDLIITMNMINGLDSAATIHQFLKEKKLIIPLVVVGNPTKEIPHIIIVQSSYHLKNLLSTSADILGVTSKSMALLPVPEYYSVDIKFLMQLTIAPCQMFMQIKKSNDENNYVLIAKRGTQISEFLRKFSSEGITNLYVNKFDRLLVINQISTMLCDLIASTENLGIPEKSEVLEIGFEFIAADFCQSPEGIQEVMNIANACTKTIGEMGKHAPGLRSLLQILNSKKNGYIYVHSILSSFIATHIVKKISWGGESHLEKINFVLFFHDIMLAPIYANHPNLKYEEDLLFSPELSDKEKEIVLNHARLSAELIITYRGTPMGADLLIKQHHGMTNGVGFAVEFKDDISPLSKIVIISEAFVEEYMKGKDNDPNFQIDLKKIIPDLIRKFKKNTYKNIIETLETLNL